jgi:hypothetical protein
MAHSLVFVITVDNLVDQVCPDREVMIEKCQKGVLVERNFVVFELDSVLLLCCICIKHTQYYSILAMTSQMQPHVGSPQSTIHNPQSTRTTHFANLLVNC